MIISGFRWLARLVVLFFPLQAIAQTGGASEPFTERTPAYFVDRYGSATSSVNVSTCDFIVPKSGSVQIKGQFSVRGFRSGDLRVEAIFFLPSLKLAAVKLRLPRQWTAEQIEAALAVYGGDWKIENPSVTVKTWNSGEHAKAIFLLSSLEIQSPEIVVTLDRRIAEIEASRKAVPRF